MSKPTLLIGYPMGSPIGLATALAWAGIDHDIARVDLLDRPAAFLRINARGEVPVLIDAERRVLTETLAIARWIEDRDEDRHVSFSPGSRDALRMWELASFLNTGFTGAFVPFWAAMEAPHFTAEQREFLRAFGKALVRKRHDQLEAMLGDGPWLMGEHRSLADTILLGVGRWVEFHEVFDINEYPRIAAVRARIEKDPAAQAAARMESDADNPQVIDLSEALARAH